MGIGLEVAEVKHMTSEHDRCAVCGAQLRKKRISYTQELDGKMYLVREVPAEVCDQCGEQYLTPETVEILQEIVEHAASRGGEAEFIQVPVFRFPQSTAT